MGSHRQQQHDQHDLQGQHCSNTTRAATSSPRDLSSVVAAESSMAGDGVTLYSRHVSALVMTCLVLMLFSSNSNATSKSIESTDSQQQLRATAISGDSKQSSRRLTVFGDDDRRPVSDPSQYPYSAVGLLRWSADLSCTASLIGDKYVVTAAECALDPDGNVLKSTFTKPEFLPGLAAATAIDDTTATTAKALVTRVHKQSDYWKKWTQNTYVILELDSPIGQKHGVLQLPTLSDLDQSSGKTEVQIAGYNADTAATTVTMQYAKCTCYFPSEFQGPQYLLHHDCDTSTAGSPGSPLLVRYTSMKTYIIGIHSNAIGNAAGATTPEPATHTEFTQDVANRGVLGPFIQKHLEFLINGSTADTKESASASSGSLDNGAPDSNSSDSTTPSTGDGDSSSSSSPVASAKPASKPPQTTASSSSSSSSGSESVVSDPSSDTNASNANERITPAAAYICIAFVCVAWACILFTAVRHLRGGPPHNDEQYEEV
ncbi:V8-like glu-specific endopeptidase, partial [Globisporangium splendens]